MAVKEEMEEVEEMEEMKEAEETEEVEETEQRGGAAAVTDPRGVLRQGRAFLDFFWDIAKPEQEVRLAATENLLRHLREGKKVRRGPEGRRVTRSIPPLRAWLWRPGRARSSPGSAQLNLSCRTMSSSTP